MLPPRWHAADVREVFRPWLGPALTIVIAVVCVVTLIAAVARDGMRALWLVGPWLALVGGSCWALFWRPHVVVDESRVRLVNVLRTIDLPWRSICAVDTKWALTLITVHGRVTAWAAPAPGNGEALRTYSGQDLRRGDLSSNAPGGAALFVCQRLEQLRDGGYLDDPRLAHEPPAVTWHWATIGVAVGLIALGIAGRLV